LETVRFLSELHQDDLATAGGKGANLAAMIRAQLPVPPGFVVLTNAYRAFVQKSGLNEEIEAVAGEGTARTFEELEARTLWVRERFLNAEIPGELVDSIAQAYEALGFGRVTPMGIEYWRVLTAGFVRMGTGKPNRELRWFKRAAGRMFVDVTEMLRSKRRWAKMAKALSEKDPITARALLEFHMSRRFAQLASYPRSF
jgi:hypothetical protein